MKKQVITLTLAAAMTGSLLAGCGQSAATAPKSAGTTTAAAAASETTAAAESSDGTDWASDYKFTASSDNPAAPDWSEYDKLVSEIYADADLEDREAKLHEAEDMLMATGAVLPIYYYNDLYLENTHFSGDFSTVFGTKYFMYAKKDGQPTDKMRINLASEPAHLDPQLNSTVDGAALASNSFVGLYTSNADGKIVPALADGDPETTNNADGTVTYVVKMKTGLKWSDGSTLNANDIVESWQRAVDPTTASDYAYLFDVFSKNDDGTIKAEATDENTVTFTLAAPCPYMMNLLAFPVFMPVPKAARDENAQGVTPGTWAQEAGFVSNGAYTLKSWTHDESMTYVKNPNFYDAANVSVDELDFMLSADDTAILGAYQAGNLDYADTVPTGEIQNLKNGDDFHVVDNLGTYYVAFNVKSKMFEGKTVEQAAAMRRALALLIDRQYIIDTQGQTEQKVATSFVPIGMSDGHGGEFKKNDDAYTYPVDDGYFQDYSVAGDANLETARKLLESAGYKFDDSGMLSADTPLTINYLINKGTLHEGIAQAIQQDFAQIGITTNINQEDWQTFLSDRKQGNFDVAREGWLADYDDPINMIEIFSSQSGNNDCQLGK